MSIGEKAEFYAVYHGQVSDIYHAHQLAWEVAGRPNGADRDFLFRFTRQNDKTVFHVRNTEINVNYITGQVLGFSIDVCPSLPGNNKACQCITVAQAAAWFERKANQSGFQILDAEYLFNGSAGGKKIVEGRPHYFSIKLWSVSGTLLVTDAHLFVDTVKHGMGRMKAFGQGMMVTKPTTAHPKISRLVCMAKLAKNLV
jgi:CRISPR-associated protein Cas6/Cse3/CasE subtype I-E